MSARRVQIRPAAWPKPTACEMAEALTGISELHILGDLSRGEEEVYLDSVRLRHANTGHDTVPMACYDAMNLIP